MRDEMADLKDEIAKLREQIALLSVSEPVALVE